ncbi:hypothetical protein TNCV_2721721 [Trichonephila clavipes]|nr:hypothetical protein TNCV_2721721 [Trichonephila clavipes]
MVVYGGSSRARHGRWLSHSSAVLPASNGQEIKWAETDKGYLRTRDQRRKEEARDGGRREVYKESERVRRRRDLREPFESPFSERKNDIESAKYGGIPNCGDPGTVHLSPRSKADFGTVEIAKEQMHGGFGARKLPQTRCGITESEPSFYRTYV